MSSLKERKIIIKNAFNPVLTIIAVQTHHAKIKLIPRDKKEDMCILVQQSQTVIKFPG